MKSKLFIVMPAYNEEANIEEIVKQWYPIVQKTGDDSRLVIVNDGSKDQTFEIMQKLAKTHLQFVPITKSNSGHGPTCLFAYRYAINENADYIFQTDSDGQTQPNEFWKFWNDREKYDFIIGERKNRHDGLSRIVVTKILKLILFIKFGVQVKDANTPFRLMKANHLKKLLEKVPDNFFLSNVLISCLIVLNKENHTFIPITFEPRQKGTNSINLKRIFKIGIRALKDFDNAKKKYYL